MSPDAKYYKNHLESGWDFDTKLEDRPLVLKLGEFYKKTRNENPFSYVHAEKDINDWRRLGQNPDSEILRLKKENLQLSPSEAFTLAKNDIKAQDSVGVLNPEKPNKYNPDTTEVYNDEFIQKALWDKLSGLFGAQAPSGIAPDKLMNSVQVANNATTRPSGIEGMIGEAPGVPSNFKAQNKFENIAGSTPTQGIASEAVFQETPKLNFGDGGVSDEEFETMLDGIQPNGYQISLEPKKLSNGKINSLGTDEYLTEADVVPGPEVFPGAGVRQTQRTHGADRDKNIMYTKIGSDLLNNTLEGRHARGGVAVDEIADKGLDNINQLNAKHNLSPNTMGAGDGGTEKSIPNNRESIAFALYNSHHKKKHGYSV